jgi:hypothetical protein
MWIGCVSALMFTNDQSSIVLTTGFSSTGSSNVRPLICSWTGSPSEEPAVQVSQDARVGLALTGHRGIDRQQMLLRQIVGELDRGRLALLDLDSRTRVQPRRPVVVAPHVDRWQFGM